MTVSIFKHSMFFKERSTYIILFAWPFSKNKLLACWLLSDCWCEDKIAVLMFTSTSSVKTAPTWKKNCKMGKGRKFHSLKCPKNFERVDVFIVLTCLFCEHDKVMSACTLDHTGLLSLDGCRRVLTNFFLSPKKVPKVHVNTHNKS